MAKKKKATPSKKKGLAAIVASEVSAASRVAASLLAADDGGAALQAGAEAATPGSAAGKKHGRAAKTKTGAPAGPGLFDVDEAGKSLEFFGDDKRKSARLAVPKREQKGHGAEVLDPANAIAALNDSALADSEPMRKRRRRREGASSETTAAEVLPSSLASEAAAQDMAEAMIAPLTEESLRQEHRGALDVLTSVLEQNDDAKSEASIDDPLPKKPAAATRNARKVFIGNIAWKADEETLRRDFGECGQIETLTIPKNKQTGNPMGVAFIVYDTEEAVENALKYDGKTYFGRKLRVALADPDAKGKDGGTSKGGAEAIDKTVEKAPSVGRHHTRVLCGERVARADDPREQKKLDEKAQQKKWKQGSDLGASKLKEQKTWGANQSKSLLVPRWGG